MRLATVWTFFAFALGRTWCQIVLNTVLGGERVGWGGIGASFFFFSEYNTVPYGRCSCWTSAGAAVIMAFLFFVFFCLVVCFCRPPVRFYKKVMWFENRVTKHYTIFFVPTLFPAYWPGFGGSSREAGCESNPYTPTRLASTRLVTRLRFFCGQDNSGVSIETTSLISIV